MTSLTLTPHESVTIRESTPELLEVEMTYRPGGRRLPAHLHPQQDESFEVLSGTIGARIDGEERTYGPGDTFEVPRGAVHQMWNPGGERPERSGGRGRRTARNSGSGPWTPCSALGASTARGCPARSRSASC